MLAVHLPGRRDESRRVVADAIRTSEAENTFTNVAGWFPRVHTMSGSEHSERAHRRRSSSSFYDDKHTTDQTKRTYDIGLGKR